MSWWNHRPVADLFADVVADLQGRNHRRARNLEPRHERAKQSATATAIPMDSYSRSSLFRQLE